MTRLVSHLGLLGVWALLGVSCTHDADGEDTTSPPDSAAPQEQPAAEPVDPVDQAPVADACSELPSISKFFPSDRCCDQSTAKQLMGTTWAEYETGPIHDSNAGGYYSEKRITFSPGSDPGKLELTIESRGGRLGAGRPDPDETWLSDPKVADKHWARSDVEKESMTCRSCGELLECDGKLTTAKVIDGWLYFNDPVLISDDTLYAVHNQHEILIHLPKDILTATGGAIEYDIREVGSGSASKKTGKFESEDTEIFRWTNNAGRFIRQGDPSRQGRKVQVETELGWLWLEHDPTLGWVTTLTGGYRFPTPSLLRDLSDYHVPLNLGG